MKRALSYFIVFVAWAAYSLPTRAQYFCSVTSDSTESNYIFTALSCKGNDCTVSALASNSIGGITKIVFLRSLDGGFTWMLQDPGLPSESGDQTYISTVEQIDSLNVIAIGDSGLVVHTSDGGATWQRQSLSTNHTVEGVSFSSPLNGIIAVADTPSGIFVTSNGGNDWAGVPFSRVSAWQCHDYGEGNYRLFIYYSGKTYTTTDNWNTIDSTEPIYSDSTEAIHHGLGKCNFGGGDTMIAYGTHYVGTLSNSTSHPFITRTTDAGVHWNAVYDDTNVFSGSVLVMSDIDRDTIIAGVNEYFDKILISTDRGTTWGADTLICNNSHFAGYDAYGVGLNNRDDLVGAFALGELSSSLIIGRQSLASVTSKRTHGDIQLYPNPATEVVNITSDDAGQQVLLMDILGREVLRGFIPSDGALKLDVSTLPSGLYLVTDGNWPAKFDKE